MKALLQACQGDEVFKDSIFYSLVHSPPLLFDRSGKVLDVFLHIHFHSIVSFSSCPLEHSPALRECEYLLHPGFLLGHPPPPGCGCGVRSIVSVQVRAGCGCGCVRSIVSVRVRAGYGCGVRSIVHRCRSGHW